MKDDSAKPFIKWVGGKTQLLKQIDERLPDMNQVETYIEPFLGGGSVFFHMKKQYPHLRFILNDYNDTLITTYRSIRDNLDLVSHYLQEWELAYLPLSVTERAAFYYEKRIRFNHLNAHPQQEQETELSALFIFLNKTCFNGLYRVNRSGGFNVPHGAYTTPKIYDEKTLLGSSSMLQETTLISGSYQHLDEHLIDIDLTKSLIYLDPPYRPLSTTASFNSYHKDSFNDDSQKELAQWVHNQSIQGSKVLLSNSDPKSTNPEDDFFDDLYSTSKGFVIDRVLARRAISSKASTRGQITEIMVKNY